MRIDIMTLFPATVDAVLHESIIGRAAKKGIVEINCVQIRDYTENKQNQVDDYPYGGGFGCVMMAQPLKSCLDAIKAQTEGMHSRVIYMSPQGKPYTQETAKRLKRDYDHLVLVCGHYEGVDERFIEECVDEEISLGDFVLTGGEIAAMAVADSVCRLVPGVLADEQCYTGESHWDGLLEYPQYTRPEVWEGRAVPEVLLNGDHSRVELWRRRQQLERTKEKRPDMYEKFEPQDETDRKLMKDVERSDGRIKLTEKLQCVPAEKEDVDRIMEIVAYARRSLGALNVDQWQGDYPNVDTFRADITAGTCHVLTYQGAVAAVFTLSRTPEPAYDALTDGRWRSDRDHAAVLHRNAVAADWRGTGMADHLMQAAEQLARESGAHAIRVDTHRHNGAQKKLLERHGYRFCGNILCDEPGHDPRRQAFEKLLR